MPRPPQSRPRQSLPHYPALDGMRGISIFTMLLYHLDIGVASGAFLALSMFFTLSGYLIAGHLIAEHERTGRVALASFWERRLRRLLPASTLCLTGVALYTLWSARSDIVARNAGDILAALFYVPNWRFIATGQSYEALFSDPSPVLHFWSLGVEEQFYLAFPVLVAVVLARGSRRSLAMVIGGVTVLSCAAMMLLRTHGAPLGHAYYGTDARAAEILIGALVAMWVGGRLRSKGPADPGAGSGVEHTGGPSVAPDPRLLDPRALDVVGILALTLSLVLWFTTSEQQLWFYRGGAPAHALLTGVVILFAIRPGPVQTLLSLPVLVYVGRISYGLYVYHWPIYLALDRFEPALGPLGLVVAKGLVVALVAALSHRFVEAPVRDRRLFAGPRRWLAPIAAIAGVGVLALALIGTHRGTDALISSGLEESAAIEQTGIGEASDRPRILVVGDSLAHNVMEGLGEWAVQHQSALVYHNTRLGCALARGGEFHPRYGSIDQQCATGEKGWRQAIARVRPDVVVLLSGGMDILDQKPPGQSDYLRPGDAAFDAWLIAEYRAVIDVLTSRGTVVAWLTWPCGVNLREVVGLEANGFAAPDRIRWFNAELMPQVVASRPEVVEVIDFFGHVCPGGEFSHALGAHKNVRPDGLHFSVAGRRYIADWLGPQLVELARDRSLRLQ